MASVDQLSRGTVARLLDGDLPASPCMQVLAVKPLAAGGGAAQRAGCGRRRCDAYPWAAATPSSHPDFSPAGGTEVWSSLQTLERDGSPGGKIGYQPTILK